MIDWPAVLRPRAVTISPQGSSRSGGRSLSGVERVVSSSAGFWAARLQLPVLATQVHVLEYRAMLARLGGRAGTIRVPFFDRRHNPAGVVAFTDPAAYAASLSSGAPHDDDAGFDDDATYSERTILMRLGAGLAAQAETASITIDSGHALRAGQYFSIASRAYVVRDVLAATATSATVSFWPPARVAALAGDDVEMDDPVCVMRLAADEGYALELDLLRYAAPVLDFVEA